MYTASPSSCYSCTFQKPFHHSMKLTAFVGMLYDRAIGPHDHAHCLISFAMGPFILDIEKFLCHWITMAYKSLDTSAGWGTERSERKITPIYSLTPLKTNHCPSRVKGTQCNQHTTKCPVALLKGWCCSRGSGSNSVAERLNPQQQHSHISLSKRKPMLLTFGIASIPTIGALICELLQ